MISLIRSVRRYPFQIKLDDLLFLETGQDLPKGLYQIEQIKFNARSLFLDRFRLVDGIVALEDIPSQHRPAVERYGHLLKGLVFQQLTNQFRARGPPAS